MYTGSEKLWVVLVMRTAIGIEMPWGVADIPLSFAPGMVGAVPVFGTREEAEAFSEGKYAVACVTPSVRVTH